MHRKWIAVAVLAFASTGQAFAQDDQDGAYIGLGIGDFSSSIDDINFDEDESALKLFGGYRFNQFLGVQLDYYDLGKSASGAFGFETMGYAARVEGTLPLAFVELFATAGLLYSSVEAEFNGVEFLDESDNDPVYSVGIGFEIAERLVLRLEYEIIDIETFDDSEALWFTAAWRL